MKLLHIQLVQNDYLQCSVGHLWELAQEKILFFSKRRSKLTAQRKLDPARGISGSYLRDAARCWRDSSEIKFAQVVVVLSHGSFTLKDLNGHGRLVVGSSGENLRLLRGDHSVTAARKKCGSWWVANKLRLQSEAVSGEAISYRGMSFVMTPPTVSMPRERGLTSNNTKFPVSSSPVEYQNGKNENQVGGLAP